MTDFHALITSGLFLPILFAAGTARAGEAHRHTNRLASEKSPYLLQHAHNPVDWYPWGDEAFEKARREDKPVFLSIGYSTCHWCHVMEEESFEDETTAALLNDRFVSIKVDREERPDIDGVYMNYVMATTGSGGWPMSVFLTPDRKPFYGGTYFPPEDRYGMPGFKSLLKELADAWKTRRSEIVESADSAAAFLGARRQKGEAKVLGEETLAAGYTRFERIFDDAHGGFGRAPKFPRSHVLSFILRQGRRSGEPRALEIVEKTLKGMAGGGMYDRLGGGFHRYSVDGQWRIPHFEKMLYDQALLVATYVEAYQATGDAFYARIARETLDYVLREMTSPEGGFYSAQDADSEDPHVAGKKREGAFFVWKKEEIEKILGAENAKLAVFRYGVEPAGNALSDPHNEFKEQNVLYDARTLEATASEFGLKAEEAVRRFEGIDRALFDARKKRPAPYLDDKVLADWNGLMIAAFARAGRALDEPRYVEAAARAASFAKTGLTRPDGTLYHRWRGGEAGIPGNLNDYASQIEGRLALYEATFDEAHLTEALRLADILVRLFHDEEDGGFYLTAADAGAPIARLKESHDGAVPSGNSVAALAFVRLERITADRKWRDLSDRTLEALSADVAAEPTSLPYLLMALDYAIGPSAEVVLAGRADDPALAAFTKAVFGAFAPNKVVLFHKEGQGAALEKIAPYVKDQTALEGRMTAYVCRDHVCGLPTADPAAAAKALEPTKPQVTKA